MQIRSATPADIPSIRHLEEQSSTAAHWTQPQYDSLFLPDAPTRVVLVSTDESHYSRVVGFLVSRCLPDGWEIENVVVDDNVRRQGLGSALVGELVKRAVHAGAAALLLEVRESNAPAMQLYEKLGFRINGLRKQYYHNPVENALLYRLPLQKYDKIP